jgi:hypothetical protein
LALARGLHLFLAAIKLTGWTTPASGEAGVFADPRSRCPPPNENTGVREPSKPKPRLSASLPTHFSGSTVYITHREVKAAAASRAAAKHAEDTAKVAS